MSNSSIDVARSDEAICKALQELPDSSRWVVFSAFYASLHYVDSKVFPCDVTLDDGTTQSAATLDTHFRLNPKSNRPTHDKHLYRLKLFGASGAPSDVVSAYDVLLTYSKYRYSTEDVPDRDLNDAIQCLSKIKSHCDPA